MALSRRRFLRAAAAAAATPLFVRALAAQAASDTILVVIQQDGGCDLLNTVVPLAQYGPYADLRRVPGGTGSIAVALSAIDAAKTAFDPNPATPAASATSYALHPRMVALRTLYGAGKVAVVLGAGIPPDDGGRTSHEVGKFDWSTGTINQIGYANTGWIGLAVDALGANAAPGSLPPATALNYESPVVLQGRLTSPLVLGDALETFAIPCSGSDADCTERVRALIANDGYPSAAQGAEFARGLASSTTSYVDTVRRYTQAVPAADYPDPGTSDLKFQLKQIARLVAAGAPTRAYFAAQGGYDTHSGQNDAGGHPDLVGELSDAVAQFYAYLGAHGIAQRVVVMTMTDFGRRPEANSTAGTDHGTTSVSFVVGDRVKGGVYGAYPDLGKLDDDGNTLVQLDFRNHIADLIGALGADPVPIVGRSYPSLGYFR